MKKQQLLEPKQQEMLQQAQKIFTPHKELTVRIKDDATNPFGSTMFDKFIEMKKQRPIYILCIHPQHNYMSFTCPTCKELDPVKHPIDDKLWIEILCIFKIVHKKKK